MKFRWEGIIKALRRRYGMILMWSSVAFLVIAVAVVLASWTFTKTVGVFNEEIMALETQVKNESQIPEARSGLYRSSLDSSESYALDSDAYSRNIFAKYKEPVVVEEPVEPSVQIVIEEPVIVEQPEEPIMEVASKPEFELKRTIQEPIPLIWAGELKKGDSLLYFQVNTPGNTYFVEKDNIVEGFKILSLEGGKLKIQKVATDAITYLEYKKQSMDKELFAEIFIVSEDRPETVRVGSKLNGYTVVEIQESFARLKNDADRQTLTLTINETANEETSEITEPQGEENP